MLFSDREGAAYVWIQTETQVFERIGVLEDVKVTQFVCEFQNSSVLLGTKHDEFPLRQTRARAQQSGAWSSATFLS